VPLDVIQAILGHANLAMTQRYAHIQADATRLPSATFRPPPFPRLTAH
jgi:site-specific recombinase XerD